MPTEWSIRHPEQLVFPHGAELSRGANQSWFTSKWKQQAGCGPTVCASLLMYIAKTRPAYAALCPYDTSTSAGVLQLMEEVWRYVTPGNMGVNSTKIFTTGAQRFAENKGLSLGIATLEVPPKAVCRLSDEAVFSFLEMAFTADLPVAFLNLSNGALQNLDSWHWVTLTGAGSGPLWATMLDEGRQQQLDLSLWLSTTALGGGFVALLPLPAKEGFPPLPPERK